MTYSLLQCLPLNSSQLVGFAELLQLLLGVQADTDEQSVPDIGEAIAQGEDAQQQQQQQAVENVSSQESDEDVGMHSSTATHQVRLSVYCDLQSSLALP